jgi:hypothetical protein
MCDIDDLLELRRIETYLAMQVVERHNSNHPLATARRAEVTGTDPSDIDEDLPFDGSLWRVFDSKGHRYYYVMDVCSGPEGDDVTNVQEVRIADV